MSEWIRPAGCQSGSCVEYRTVAGAVFVRNSEQPEELMEFTVAEWDTFVAGLTAPVVAQRDASNLIRRGITEENRALAAENARLRQQVAEAQSIAEQATTLVGQRADEVARLQKIIAENPAWAAYLAVVDDAALRRYTEDLAAENRSLIAEAAVLRHRDRRTQAVVDAAVAWRDDLRQVVDSLYGGVDPFEHQAPAQALLAAVDAYEDGPTEPPASPLPAHQPPVEDTATDGLEAQGEAQPAAGPSRVWDKGEGPVAWLHVPEPRRPVPHEIFAESLANDWSCSCGASGRGNHTAHVYSNTPMPPEVTPGSHMSMTVRAPRVWNAGDPEPEGVTRVTDEDGDTWVRDAPMWVWTDDWGLSNAQDWSPLLKAYGPLTEVLPEPTTATGGIIPAGIGFAVEPDPVERWVPFATSDLTTKAHRISSLIDVGLGNVTKPDGVVPEAGRAGEAREQPAAQSGVWHTGRSWQGHPVEDECPCPKQPCGLVNLSEAAAECTQHPMTRFKTMRQGHLAEDCPGEAQDTPQDRTEGLDAAIEAAAIEMFRAAGRSTRGTTWADIHPERQGWYRDMARASPLIERAALHAAADRMDGRGYPNESASAWLRLWAEGKTV